MTRKTDPELLIKILDTYTSGETNSLARVAEICGVSFRSIYAWLKDPEIIVPEYMGMVGESFGKCMNVARNVSKALTVSRSLEDFVLNGRKIQIVHHGEFAYVDDEAAIRATDEELALGIEVGYFFTDRKKRDQNGDRIIATRIENCPAQILEVYARAAQPSVYGQKSEVTMRGNVNLGVTVAAQVRRPVPAEFIAFASAADLEGTVTETVLVNDDSEVEIYETDTGLADLLGLDEVVTDTPPDEVEPEPDFSPAPEPERVEPVIREAVPTPPSDPLLSIAPGWRAEYAALQSKIADKTNRKA